MPNDTVRWGVTGAQVEPVDAKKDGGSNAGKPEAAEYVNWLWNRFGAGVSLDRKEDLLLHMPLKNSLAIEQGVGSATFARSTVGTYIDRYGVVQTAAIDEPRFEKEGYLVEGASTNEMLRSKDQTNVAWNKVRSSISGNTTGPDNVASSADKLIEDSTATNSHYLSQLFDSIPGDNNEVSAFCDAKEAERTWIKVSILDKVGVLKGAWFDLANGAIGTEESGITGRIKPLVNGFYRCSVELDDIDAGGTTPQILVYLATGDNVTVYSGDGSSGAYITDGQAEDLPFSSSYIDTVAAAVTRTADNLDVSPEENVPETNAPQTWFFDADFFGNNGGNQFLYLILGETAGRNMLFSHASGFPTASFGTPPANGPSTLDVNIKHRMGGRRKSTSEVTLWVKGVRIAISISTNDTTGTPTTLAIGDNLYGHISNLRVYDRALTDFEMAVA